jgi:acyl-CoA synthetase (AMP-forming)/AMP-acid ligase II
MEELDVENLHHRRAVHRWGRMSIGDVFERLTWSVPDRVALTAWDGAYADERFRQVTYAQADAAANAFAQGLLAHGLEQGDRVLLVCENTAEAFLAKIGIAKAGLVAVPVNPSFAPDVLDYLLELVKPRLAVVDAELWPRVQDVLVTAQCQVAVTIPVGGDVVPGSRSFSEFVDAHPATEPDVAVHADDIWQILFTSGTTAMPKGVMLSHSYSHLAAMGFALSLTRGLRVERDLKVCSFLPMIYHVGDQVFALSAFFSGGGLLLGRRPEPAAVAAAITSERATALWGGSPQFVDALVRELQSDASAYDVSSLTTLVYGWAALSPSTKRALEQLSGSQLLVFEIFGQTEAIACHRFWPDVWEETYESTAPLVNYVGVPSPLLSSDVVDASGRSLRGQPGVPGEAVYRSPVMTAGYYRDRAATAEAFRGGWFHSGDSCAYDEQGLRIMVDRFKDIVKSGGENVSSMRVESVLATNPDVLRAVVIGVPHDRWGEAVTAVVIRREGSDVSEGELLEWCRTRLAGYESPKGVVFTDALPETVGGKVLKYKLRHEFGRLYDEAGR